jgi:hypothetical protein
MGNLKEGDKEWIKDFDWETPRKAYLKEGSI